MKRHWQIRRQFQPTADGARRWDQAYQYLLDWTASPWLTDKSRDVFIHESASVKMPPQHNEINAFSEEDAHGEHVFPL
jgi:hypothetical protein